MTKNKKTLFTLALTMLLVITFIVYSLITKPGVQLAKLSNTEEAKVLQSFLAKEKIDYNYNTQEHTFKVDKELDLEEIQYKVLILPRIKFTGFLLTKRNEDESEKSFLKRYNTHTVNILKKVNPHLKYAFKIKSIGESYGEKVYQIQARIDDVLSRDNTQELIKILSVVYQPIAPLSISIYNDEKKRIYSESYGLVFQGRQLQKKIESTVKKLLSPLIDVDRSYVVIDSSNLKKPLINVLIENASDFNDKEKQILVSAIENKLFKKTQLETKVEINQINSLANQGTGRTSLISSQDSFLYLLLITTFLLFVYLVISIYVQNKKRFERAAKIKEIEEQELLKSMDLEEQKNYICEQIEALVVYKSEVTIQLIELFIKNRVGYDTGLNSYNSPEICAIVIRELEQEARGVIFDGLGTYNVEQIISHASSEHLKLLKVEETIVILESFNHYLNEEASLMSYNASDSQDHGKESFDWKGNHLVELIKNAALQKNAIELAKFFENENPVFTSLIFVSLSSNIQDEIWKNLSYKHKETLCLNLATKGLVSDQAIKLGYDCYKQVS